MNKKKLTIIIIITIIQIAALFGVYQYGRWKLQQEWMDNITRIYGN